jgi:alpha-galactosidase
MIRLGKASVPIDLMDFEAEDKQPSVFFLKEDVRQGILTVFNWTDKERNRSVDLATAGLPATGRYEATDVFSSVAIPVPAANVLAFHQPPHSVQVLKIVDAHVPEVAPSITTDHPSVGNAGIELAFAVHNTNGHAAVSYRWDLDDGVTLEGSEVKHAYTQPGTYNVRLTATGLTGLSAEDRFQVRISGHMRTTFNPQSFKRYE